MQNIFVSCGEVSGDIYAAGFIREFLNLRPEFKNQIWGMLGPKGENSGGCAKWSYEELKLMGILEVIPALPRILNLIKKITQEIIKSDSNAAILIDSPDFHLALAKSLRKSGYKGKIISLIPPTVWAWRSGRVNNLKRDFDFCLPLFSFEHEFLISKGVKSFWKSHPLVHDMKDLKIPDSFFEKFKGKKIIALMPGSRGYDIKFHLDILIETAKILKKDKYFPVFSVARGLSDNLAKKIRDRVKESGFEIWEGEGRELMLGSIAIAGVSGTVAVEAMLLGKFMVVIYNMKKLTHEILKRLVHVKKISIPNYLTIEPVYPELICENAKPEKIAFEIENYLNNSELKNQIDLKLKKAKDLMGYENAAKFWAECVNDVIKI